MYTGVVCRVHILIIHVHVVVTDIIYYKVFSENKRYRCNRVISFTIESIVVAKYNIAVCCQYTWSNGTNVLFLEAYMHMGEGTPA